MRTYVIIIDNHVVMLADADNIIGAINDIVEKSGYTHSNVVAAIEITQFRKAE